MGKRYFVFRVNYDDAHNWVMDELFNKGILRQGWGILGLELVDKNDKRVKKEIWLNNYLSIWNDSGKKISGRFDILSRMLDIKKGDMIVIPKTKNNYTLTICEVIEGYHFDFKNKTFWDDFKHTIKITNPRSYKYDSFVEAKQIAAKFRAYQSPVNNIWNREVQNKIIELYKKESSDKSKKIKQIIEEISDKVLPPFADQFLGADPSYFEDVIMECLKSRGYERIGMRKYDKEGADVDIIASYSLPFFSDLIDYLPTLLIQIKKKIGTDWNDEKGVDQLIKSSCDYPHSIKILVNTTDEFSYKSRKKAAENEIHIISGLKIFDLILKTELKNT